MQMNNFQNSPLLSPTVEPAIMLPSRRVNLQPLLQPNRLILGVAVSLAHAGTSSPPTSPSRSLARSLSFCARSL